MKKEKPRLSFEASLKRLQEITGALEAGTLPLEEGIALYKEGVALAAACRKRLETARNEIKLYSEGLQTIPFTPGEQETQNE